MMNTLGNNTGKIYINQNLNIQQIVFSGFGK